MNLAHLDFPSLNAFGSALSADLNQGLLWLFVSLAVVYMISGLDDLFIDLTAAALRLAPESLATEDLRALHAATEKRFAILVPAWDEGEIIDRMILGNLERIEYGSYHFFVGVYPNDPRTVAKVQELGRRHPNVHAVVNCKEGPTSKGQILNYVVRQILEFEKESGARFDGFLMQDAEDLIHPKTLKLVNARLGRFDFVQVPVFSLEVRPGALVAGTYIDEFAESHTKDILVRQRLGAAIPSAGVGTALSRELVLQLLERQGSLLNEGSLTEDYELGVRAHRLGFRPHVACAHYGLRGGAREFVATREFFPRKFSRSVRQKTRWTTGIALQGWRNLKWRGTIANRYFLARDRKGILTNIATFLGYPTVLMAAGYAALVDGRPLAELTGTNCFRGLVTLNLILMLNRAFQRGRCVWKVYGAKAVLTLPVRWPVGSTINALAAFRAIRNDLQARTSNVTLTWVKTEHELPEFFGKPAEQLEVAT